MQALRHRGIWGYSDSESEQDVRSGAYVRVTAHVDEGHESAVFAALELAEASR